jgi:hypothetical protein
MTGDDAILGALEQQVGHYRRLAKLAELQHDHVQQGRTEELLGVLGKRQELLDQIALAEHTLAPSKRRWSEYLAELGAPARQRAESLLVETRRLLEQITAADRDDALMLQQRKLSLGRQISAARSARHVNRSYATAAYGAPPSRLDVTGR